MNIFKKGFTDSKGGIMPSVFTSLDSKMSRPLTSRQELENWIRHNKELAGLTDAYRKGLATVLAGNFFAAQPLAVLCL